MDAAATTYLLVASVCLTFANDLLDTRLMVAAAETGREKRSSSENGLSTYTGSVGEELEDRGLIKDGRFLPLAFPPDHYKYSQEVLDDNSQDDEEKDLKDGDFLSFDRRALDSVGMGLIKKGLDSLGRGLIKRDEFQRPVRARLDRLGSGLIKRAPLERLGMGLIKRAPLERLGMGLIKRSRLDSLGMGLIKRYWRDRLIKRPLDSVGVGLIKKRLLDSVGSGLIRKRSADSNTSQ